jgi:hypothetical protein
LFRSYRDNRARLLFWSTFCFVMLAANNIVLFVDLIVVPDVNLSVVRGVLALIGLGGLYALIWETR